uniref:hypothetical protein n=1 Tax=Klebsiella pneumoniae TaxID=573 RepID=UPI001F4A8EC0
SVVWWRSLSWRRCQTTDVRIVGFGFLFFFFFFFFFSVVIDPGSAGSFLWVFLLPWIVVQGAGTFLMASVYGVLEGWLAIPGSTDWWPTPPPAAPIKKARPDEASSPQR